MENSKGIDLIENNEDLIDGISFIDVGLETKYDIEDKSFNIEEEKIDYNKFLEENELDDYLLIAKPENNKKNLKYKERVAELQKLNAERFKQQMKLIK